MAYTPREVPQDLESLPAWLKDEIHSLSLEINYLRPQAIYMELTHVAPTKVRTGELRMADGTDWNPGSGAGLYRWNGSSWTFIG